MRSRVVLGLLAAVVLAGCGTPAPLTPPDGPSPSTTAAPSSSAPQTPGTVAEDQRFALDDTAQFPDGLEVSIAGTQARQATAEEKGAESTGGSIVVMSILIMNGTSEVYDPQSAVITATYGPQATPARVINDASAQLATGFDAPIAPGDEGTAGMGFAIPATGLGQVTVVVDLADGFNDPISFSGKVEKG